MSLRKFGERIAAAVGAGLDKSLPESRASQLSSTYEDLRKKARNGDTNSEDILTFCGLANVDEDPVALDRDYIYFPEAEIIGHGHRRVPIAAQPLSEFFESHPGEEGRIRGLIEAKGLNLPTTGRVDSVVNRAS